MPNNIDNAKSFRKLLIEKGFEGLPSEDVFVKDLTSSADNAKAFRKLLIEKGFEGMAEEEEFVSTFVSSDEVKKKDDSDTGLDQESKEPEKESQDLEKESQDSKKKPEETKPLTEEEKVKRQAQEEAMSRATGIPTQEAQRKAMVALGLEEATEEDIAAKKEKEELEKDIRAKGLDKQWQAEESMSRIKRGDATMGDEFIVKNQQYKQNLEERAPEINQIDFELNELDKQQAKLENEYGSLDKIPEEELSVISNRRNQLKTDKNAISGKSPADELVEKVVDVDVMETQWDEWSDLSGNPYGDLKENLARKMFLDSNKELLKDYFESNPEKASEYLRKTQDGLTLDNNDQYNLLLDANASKIDELSLKIKDMTPEVDNQKQELDEAKNNYDLEMNDIKSNHPEVYKLLNNKELTDQDKLILQQKGGKDYVLKVTTPLNAAVQKYNDKRNNSDLINEYQKVFSDRRKHGENINILTGGGKDKEKLEVVKLAFQSKLEDIQDQIDLQMAASQSPTQEMYKNTLKSIYNTTVDFYGGFVDLAYLGYNAGKIVTDKDEDYYDVADKFYNTVKSYEDNVLKSKQSYMGQVFENGDFNGYALLPSLAETITNMALLVGNPKTSLGKTYQSTIKSMPNMSKSLGLDAIRKNSTLISRSFVSSYDDYFEEAKGVGLNDAEASSHAFRSGIITSMLEMVSPGERLFTKKMVKNNLAEMVKNSTTKNVRKEFVKNLGEETTKELMQEFSQLFGDKASNAYTNYITDKSGLDTNISSDETLNTALMTTLSVLAIGGVNKKRGGKSRDIANASIHELATNKEEALKVIERLTDDKEITPAKADELLKKIDIMEESINEVGDNADKNVFKGKAAILNYRIKELMEKRKTIKSDGLLKANQEKINKLQKQLDAVLMVNEAMANQPSETTRKVIQSDEVKKETQVLRDEEVDVVYKDENLIPERLRKLSKSEVKNEDGSVVLTFDGATMIDNDLATEKVVEKTETPKAEEGGETEATTEEKAPEPTKTKDSAPIFKAKNKNVRILNTDNGRVTLEFDNESDIPKNEVDNFGTTKKKSGLLGKTKTVYNASLDIEKAKELGLITEETAQQGKKPVDEDIQDAEVIEETVQEPSKPEEVSEKPVTDTEQPTVQDDPIKDTDSAQKLVEGNLQILTDFEGDRVITKIGKRKVIGTVFRDGNRLAIEDDNGNIIDLGNADELSKEPSKEFRLKAEEQRVSINEFNEVIVNGKTYTHVNPNKPRSSENYNSDGDLVSVTLKDSKGKKKTFRGKSADEIVYNYVLQELNERNVSEKTILQETEKHIENEKIKKGKSSASREIKETTKKGSDKNTKQGIKREPRERLNQEPSQELSQDLKSDDQITYDEDGESNAFVVKTSDLDIDPDRLQYKVEGINEDGTTDALKSTRKFNKVAAGILTVWIDPKNGKKYVVNGHHRFGLAKRQNVDNLLVRFIKADTAEEARAIGALQNMMEGKGTEIDAAKFIRDSGTTIDEIADQGVTLSDAKIDKAVKLANLTDKLFNLVINGTLSINKATMIGELDPKIQEDIYRTVGNFSDKVVREVVNTAKKAKVETTTQQDLFGITEESKSKAMEVYKLQSEVKSNIRNDKKALNNAVKNKERLEQAGNKIDVEGSLGMNKEANTQDTLFDMFSSRDELKNILNEGVERLEKAKNNKERAKIKQEIYEKYKQELQNQIDNALQTGKKASGKGKSVEGESKATKRKKQIEDLKSTVKQPNGKDISEKEAEDLIDEGYTKEDYDAKLGQAKRELKESLRKSMNNMSINPVNFETLVKLAKYMRAWILKNGSNYKAFLADLKYNTAPWLRSMFKQAVVSPINGFKYVQAKVSKKEYRPLSFDSSLAKAGVNSFSGRKSLDYYKHYLSELEGFKSYNDLLEKFNHAISLNLVSQQTTVNPTEIDALIEARDNLLNLKNEINKAIKAEKQSNDIEQGSIINKLLNGEIKEVKDLSNSEWSLHEESLREVFVKKVVDRRNPLKNVLDTIEKWHGKKLPFTSRVDSLFDIQEGKVVAKTNKAMEWLVGKRVGLTGNKNITKESFAYKLKEELGMTLEDFSKWMLVNHVPERNERIEYLLEEKFNNKEKELKTKLVSGEISQSEFDRKLKEINQEYIDEKKIANTGMSTDDAKFALRKIEENYDRKKLVEFYKEYKENIIDKQVDILADAGIITKEQADNLKSGKGKGKDFEFYVPIKVLGSVIQDAMDFNSKYRPERTQKESPIKSISVDAQSGKFSLSERNDPIAQGLFDLAEAYKAAAVNENIKQLSNLIEEYPNSNVWTTTNSPEIADKSEGKKIPFKYIGKENKVVTKYVVLKDPRLENVFMISSPQNELTKVLKKYLGAFNQYSRAMYTTLNISFGAPNALRDVQDALFNLSEYEDPKIRRTFMKNLAKSYKGVWKGERGFTDEGMAKLYQEMIDQGGTVSWGDLSGDPDQTIKDIQRSLQSVRFDGTVKGGAIYGAETLVAPIALFNNVLEQATRLAVYKTALDMDKSKDEAASMSKNVTINFSKKGEYGSFINTLWLFSNAGIQGLNRVVQTLKSKGGQKAAGILVGAGFAYSAMIHSLLDDDEETEKLLTKYDWKNNIIIPLGGDNVITISKSYSGFKLFFNLGESIFKNGTKGDLSAVPGDMFGDLYDQVNIIGGDSEAPFSKIMPEAFKPATEAFVDGVNYFDKSFIPEWLTKVLVPDKDKYYKSTGNDFIGKKSIQLTDMIYSLTEGGVDVAPETLSHLFKGYFYKGALTDVGRVYNVVDKIAKGEELKANDWPVTRRFFKDLGEEKHWRAYKKFSEIAKEGINDKMSEKEIKMLYELNKDIQKLDLKTDYLKKKSIKEYRDTYKNQLRLYKDFEGWSTEKFKKYWDDAKKK